MGKKQRLTTKKGKKVSPNVSDRTIVNAALQDYKDNVQQKLILKKHKISRALLVRYVTRYGIQRGDKTKVRVRPLREFRYLHLVSRSRTFS